MTTPYDLVIRGTLVLPDRLLPNGWIAVRGEKIAGLGQGQPPEATTVHDAESNLVFPGVVDGQTHATSAQGLAGIYSSSCSAVAGGITTLVDMPYDNPDPLNTVERLEAKIAQVNATSVADFALYGTVAPGQGVGEMERLVAGGVAAFKLSSFNSHPVRFPRIPAGDIMDILAAAAPLEIPVGLHNEDQEIVDATIAAFKAQKLTTPEYHAPSRPLAAELAASASFLALGVATGAHTHLVHVSSPVGLELTARFKGLGGKATAEVCVHYLHFDAARDTARLGARMKVSPPIRSGVLDGMWRGLEEGLIDFVSSDHSSWPLAKKQTASIFDAGAGIPGLETLAVSFYTDLCARVKAPELSLALFLCERPARFFGLWPRKGCLAVGSDADVTIIQRGAYTFDESKTHDDLNWSPYHGEPFTARIASTFLRGRKVWDGESILATPGQGHFVPRELPQRPAAGPVR